MSNPRSVLIWRGISRLDRVSPIGVFLTFHSENEKTGDLAQATIMRLDMAPTEAVKRGADSGICGHCPHMGTGNGDRTCYVVVMHGPGAIYRSWHAGNVPEWTVRQALQALGPRGLRIGAYGDPAAAPMALWRAIIRKRRKVGYTHQWRDPRVHAQGVLMASCDSIADRVAAKAKGYRTFRVSASLDLQAGEILCPASVEAGKRTTCAKCGLCDGSRGAEDRRKDILIPVHGARKKHFVLQVVS